MDEYDGLRAPVPLAVGSVIVVLGDWYQVMSVRATEDGIFIEGVRLPHVREGDG